MLPSHLHLVVMIVRGPKLWRSTCGRFMVNKEGEEYEEGCGCGEGATPLPRKMQITCRKG